MKKLFPQIFLKLFIVMFIPVVVSNLLYYKTVKREIKNYTKSIFFTKVEYVESVLKNNFSLMEHYAIQLVKYIELNPQNSDVIIKTAFYSNGNFYKILLLDEKFTVLNGISKFDPVKIGSPMHLPVKNIKNFTIIKRYNEYRLIFLNKIKGVKFGDYKYKYLYFEVSLKKLFHRFVQISSENVLYFILNNKRQLIFHSDYNLVLANAVINLPDKEDKNFYGECNIFNPIKNLNETYIIRSKYLPDYNLFIGMEMPYSVVYSKIVKIRNNITVSLFIVLLLLGVISYFLAKSIVKPVDRLRKISNEIRSGNFTPDIENFPKNEIGILADNFKFMLETINKYIQDINEERDKLNNLFNTIENGIYVVDTDYNITMINSVELSYLGKDLKDVVGKKCYEILAQSNDKCVNCPIKIGENKLPYGLDLVKEGFRKNCSRKYVNINFISFTSKETLVYIQDVTEIIESYNIIEEEKETLKVTLHSIGDGVIVTDEKGCITLMNKVAEIATGFSEQEALGKNIEEVFNIFDERTGERLTSPVKETILTKSIVLLSNHAVLYNDSGSKIHIEDSSAPILNEAGKLLGVVLVFRDVTEKRKRDIEMMKIEKLKSVGQLAGGIAHDFNNILTGIYGNVSLAKMMINNKEKLKTLLDRVESSLERARGLTQQFLTFAKGGAPLKQVTSIENCIKESVEFILTGSNIKVYYDFDKDLYNVEADIGQLSQVFQNLTLNAKQAMSNGGEIYITAKNINSTLDSEDVLEPGNYIEIIFRDTGSGIDKNVLPRIFEPFFTTKDAGSGLGLATCHSIVVNHDGVITVESEKGKGTTFKIFLPAALNQTVNKSSNGEVSQNKDENKNKLKILFMDDDETICELAKEFFSVLGCEITITEDGKDAVEKYKKAMLRNEKYDIVILDLTVPGGMGGKETVKELTKLDSNVTAVVSSGYSIDPVISEYEKYGFKYVLTKPYTVEDINKMLDFVNDMKSKKS